jgi:type II secretory pathway pseudopilin PulG
MTWASAPRSESGAVLLEVVLALSLFVFAAAIISSSLNTAVERNQRLHAQTHALNLAASVLAEIHLGLRAPQPAGPEPFETPFADWTWQILATPYAFAAGDASALQQVTVIVRQQSGPTVQRLTEILALPTPDSGAPDALGP